MFERELKILLKIADSPCKCSPDQQSGILGGVCSSCFAGEELNKIGDTIRCSIDFILRNAEFMKDID
jgi:hypothetical protein